MTFDLPTLMKILAPLVVLAAVVLIFSGCTAGLSQRLARMPDGRFATATLQETGKFTSTTIKLTAATKDNGLLTAEHISVSHTNPWLTKFEFEAQGYVVQLTPAEKKKPLPALLSQRAQSPATESTEKTNPPPAQ